MASLLQRGFTEADGEEPAWVCKPENLTRSCPRGPARFRFLVEVFINQPDFVLGSDWGAGGSQAAVTMIELKGLFEQRREEKDVREVHQEYGGLILYGHDQKARAFNIPLRPYHHREHRMDSPSAASSLQSIGYGSTNHQANM